MCTALTYFDAASRPYVARTFELNLDLPFGLAAAPAGTAFQSQMPGREAVEWTSAHAFIAAATQQAEPGAGAEFAALLVGDGVNAAGLAVNFNGYPPKTDHVPVPDAPAVLEAADLGVWLLSRFASVAEVKAALATQPVNPTRMSMAGGVPFPLHAMVTDAGGQSIVLEWNDGVLQVFDNPVHVMTNAPEFPWHLTNMDNWTHLDNVDKSLETFGSLHAGQPDSGIATASLPASNTAVGRFVRAAYYSRFAKKMDDPDQALSMAAHIINNFDRPMGITVDLPGKGGEGVVFGGASAPSGVSTEYTTHSFLADLTRGRYLIRAHTGVNWSVFHLDRLTGLDGLRIISMDLLDPMGGDATELLLSAAAH